MTSLVTFTIGEIAVRQHNGLFSLNDLHAAAGGAVRHQPTRFVRLGGTQELIAELRASPEMVTPLQTINDGKNNGTYACRELVIAYAAWISAAFHLKVIRVFLAATAPQPPALPYSLQPGQTLSVEQANWLRDFLKGCAQSLPRERQGEFLLKGWSRLKSHFGVTYRRIPAHEWAEAASLLARHAAEWGVERLPQERQPAPPQLEGPLPAIYEVRRRTLRQAMALLCDGRQATLARRLGTHPTYISRILGAGKEPKHIGGDYAREVEQRLGLPVLWLDDERNASATSIDARAADALPESARRSRELKILLGSIARLAPAIDAELAEAIGLAREISAELANDLGAMLEPARA